MEILSKRKRDTYLYGLIAVFVIGAPLLVLYSIGYRFSDISLFVKTGGITIVLREQDTALFIDDEYQRNSNFFQKTYFFQNITSGEHSVKAEKEGYQPWQSFVQVYPEFVTETFPLLIPYKIPFVEIPQFNEPEEGSKKKEAISNEEYEKLLDIFVLKQKNSSANLITYRNLSIQETTNDFTLMWEGDNREAPYYFCGVFECSNKLKIKKPYAEKVKSFDFYPLRDDGILLLTESGLYVMQIDTEQNTQLFNLYQGEKIDFYVENKDRIYIQDGGKIGYLDL